MGCLHEGQYLNDAVINFTLAWVHGETLGQLNHQVRICDALWYTKLSKDGYEPDAIQKNMEQTKRWFPPNGNPLDRNITVVPICETNHWLGVIIIKREEEISLMILDSLPSPRTNKIRTILDMVVKYCTPDQQKNWYNISVVQQKNMVDCGVHLLNNTTRFLRLIASGKYKDITEIEREIMKEQQNIGRQEVKRSYPHQKIS